MFLLYILYCQIIKHSYIYVGYRSVKVNKILKNNNKKQASGKLCKKRVYARIYIYILIKFNYEE